MLNADVLVIGAGIAGAGCAYEIARHATVALVEREPQPGYHTTGRSAALYTRTYGNETMRALTRASFGFLSSPPAGFAEIPILSPRATALVARIDQRDRLRAVFDECRQRVATLRWIGADEVRHLVPIFRDGQVDAAILEPDSSDIDVHALHHGYLRGLRARGGSVHSRAEVTRLERQANGWRVETSAGTFAAPIVVNAAGAWADLVAGLAGAAPIGLVPKRRTAVTFDPPAGADIGAWPAVIDVDEQWYVKPEAGRLLASPADETPSPPCDAQPEEYDIAVLVDRLAQATTLVVPRLRARWAGLRSFVADKTLVAGFDPDVPGFFWLAGQGGYGIQTAPAASRVAAALALGRPMPPEVAAEGVDAAHLAVSRLRTGSSTS